MSRRTRNSRKKEPSARSAACKKKMATIAEDMEGESIDSLLDDFDIQTTNLTKQSLKQFQKEARLLMSALPLKSSIPKEVLKMDLSEFIRRGGSFHLVWESLKNDKYEPEQVDKENSQVVTNTASVDEVSQGESGVDGQCMFVTPAMSTRSQRTRAKRGQTTAKRKPKPLEEYIFYPLRVGGGKECHVCPSFPGSRYRPIQMFLALQSMRRCCCSYTVMAYWVTFRTRSWKPQPASLTSGGQNWCSPSEPSRLRLQCKMMF
jgi:hypothetical protein